MFNYLKVKNAEGYKQINIVNSLSIASRTMEVDEAVPAGEVITDNLSTKLADPIPNDILNNPNSSYTIPAVQKDPDDILNVSNSNNIVPEDVNIRPKRGRRRGSFRAPMNTGTKGRENRTRTLAPVRIVYTIEVNSPTQYIFAKNRLKFYSLKRKDP